MVTSILLEFLTLKWYISRTIWSIEVSDGSFFSTFHALSFEPNYWNSPLVAHITELFGWMSHSVSEQLILLASVMITDLTWHYAFKNHCGTQWKSVQFPLLVVEFLMLLYL